MSAVILVVGARGKGKTTFNKARLKNVNKDALYIFDINKEYTEFYSKPFSADFEDFSEKANKLSKAVIVYEEATIFLATNGSNVNVRSTLVRARHTDNTIFFVFNSMADVPRWVYRLANTLILFKTNDQEKKLKFGDDKLIEIFKRVNSHPDNHYFERYNIN